MSNIWVGDKEGESLVYDPDFQISGCPHLFLWSTRDEDMGKYLAHLTRAKIKPHGNAELAAIYVERYLVWRRRYGDAWLQAEMNYYQVREEDEAEARKTPEERHKDRLAELGIEYKGTRPAVPGDRNHRVANCWSCHRGLDNSTDIECLACGWILCTCGACGCGR